MYSDNLYCIVSSVLQRSFAQKAIVSESDRSEIAGRVLFMNLNTQPRPLSVTRVCVCLRCCCSHDIHVVTAAINLKRYLTTGEVSRPIERNRVADDLFNYAISAIT